MIMGGTGEVVKGLERSLGRVFVVGFFFTGYLSSIFDVFIGERFILFFFRV